MNKNWPKLITKRVSRRLWALFAALLIIGLVEMAVILRHLDRVEQNTGRPSSPTAPISSPNMPQSFNKSKYSLSHAASLWVVVNKGRTLSSGYIPASLTIPDVKLRYSGGSEMRLREDTARALERLFAAAANDKVPMRLASGYRSHALQSTIYAREVKTYGQTQADRQSARPGHSEHQTGLAADLAPADGRCEIADCFANTTEGRWLEANSYKYGFIVRYPQSKETLTGYRYEPWHFRYVGEELAAALADSGLTLEQFFDLPVYSAYPREIYELR